MKRERDLAEVKRNGVWGCELFLPNGRPIWWGVYGEGLWLDTHTPMPVFVSPTWRAKDAPRHPLDDLRELQWNDAVSLAAQLNGMRDAGSRRLAKAEAVVLGVSIACLYGEMFACATWR